MDNQFLSFFPSHRYRYVDSTGANRVAKNLKERDDELNIKGYESFFTVNGFDDSGHSRKANCTNLNAFFVDIDERKREEELDKIKDLLDPTFIIETKRGYHVYWVLDEPIYKEDLSESEWKTAMSKWEAIEASIVKALDADKVVKDIPRILRVPDTYYWKKTGDAWKSGTSGIFKIKGIYKKIANTYSMDRVAETFPPLKNELSLLERGIQKQAELSKSDFFSKVNSQFAIEKRDSFKRLVSGEEGTIPSGFGRNNALLVTASLMREAGWDLDKAIKQIDSVGWHGLGDSEILSTIKSAYENGYSYPKDNALIMHNTSLEENNEMEEAYAVVVKSRKDKDRVRFNSYEREVLIKNPFLRLDKESKIFYNYYDGVYRIMSDIDVETFFFQGLHEDMLWGYRTSSFVRDKINCLRTIVPPFIITPSKYARVNLKNGLFNLSTGELEPHTPNFVSLIQHPVEYDPEATCPVWGKCIADWTKGPEQKEKAKLLQQYAGYILSPSMNLDRALFIVGEGANGKSTFIDTLAGVMGASATSHIDLDTLYRPFGMQGLIGKRLNIIEEVPNNYYQSDKLKKLVTGEPVTIDMKYKDQFTFRPEAKFVFAVNTLPRVDDTSTGTERRMLVIRFLQNYRKNPNVNLRSETGELAKEHQGILNWMIKGAQMLKENGSRFTETREHNKLLENYRMANSSVDGFIAECIDINEFAPEISLSDLYQVYKEWSATEGGRKTKSKINFNREFTNYGERTGYFEFRERESGRKQARFVGIELKEEWKRINSNYNNYPSYD